MFDGKDSIIISETEVTEASGRAEGGFEKIIPETDMTMDKAKGIFEDLFLNREKVAEVDENMTENQERSASEQISVLKSQDNEITEKIENCEGNEPNSTYKLDSSKYGTDDNGKDYKKDGELLPNNEYDVNGYHYKTDEFGRPISAEGTLHLKETDRAKKTINENNVGGNDKRETDDRGHMIGDQFDGSNGIDNLIPMDANLNRGEYKALENKLAQSVKDGKIVEMKVEPIFEGDSRRPSEIAVTYTIDGEKTVQVFQNEAAVKKSDGGTEK